MLFLEVLEEKPTYRKIIHVDMDAFYASIEQRDFPELRGKPVAVGGSKGRGVVAAASYEARKFGVRSAMPSSIAIKKCPHLIFAKPRFQVYKEVSIQVKDIFKEFTDLIEPLSLDEAYLDVTTNKKNLNSATLLAIEIRKRIFEETSLTASAGISFNKFLAKIASDINKPDGMKVILPEEAIEFIEQLPVEKFHGVGKVTASKMHRMGIKTGGDLKKLSKLDLVQRFGKAGRFYYKIVRAQDDRPVNPNRIRKSIGAERTFISDLSNPEEMMEKLKVIAEKVMGHMDKNKNYGRTLNLKIKYHDFRISNRSITLKKELSNLNEMIKLAKELLYNNLEENPQVRLLGLSVSNLMKDKEISKQLVFDFWWEL